MDKDPNTLSTTVRCPFSFCQMWFDSFVSLKLTVDLVDDHIRAKHPEYLDEVEQLKDVFRDR